jgi:hypothetical protein
LGRAKLPQWVVSIRSVLCFMETPPSGVLDPRLPEMRRQLDHTDALSWHYDQLGGLVLHYDNM